VRGKRERDREMLEEVKPILFDTKDQFRTKVIKIYFCTFSILGRGNAYQADSISDTNGNLINEFCF